jgi:hypothetical protein
MDKKTEKNFAEVGMRSVTTGLGFEKEGIYFVRLKKKDSGICCGVVIGIHFEKCPPEIRNDLIALTERIHDLT